MCDSFTEANPRAIAGSTLDSLALTLAHVLSAITSSLVVLPACGTQLSASEIEALAAGLAEATR